MKTREIIRFEPLGVLRIPPGAFYAIAGLKTGLTGASSSTMASYIPASRRQMMRKERNTVSIFQSWRNWWHRKSAQQKQIDAFAATVRVLTMRLLLSRAELKKVVEGNQP